MRGGEIKLPIFTEILLICLVQEPSLFKFQLNFKIQSNQKLELSGSSSERDCIKYFYSSLRCLKLSLVSLDFLKWFWIWVILQMMYLAVVTFYRS